MKPVTSIALTPGGLSRRKVSVIIALTREIVDDMSAGAQSIVSRQLRRGIVAATDRVFLAELADGVDPLPASGSTAATLLTDLGDLAALVGPEAGSPLFLVVSAETARAIALLSGDTGRAFPDVMIAGGSLAGIQIVVSDHLPTTGSPAAPVAMLIDPSGIAADSAEIVLDRAEHAALEMSDDPAVDAGGLVSLWQTNSVALRAERRFAFSKFRSDCVAVLAGLSL